ncbi:uncharacterized protein UV8b_04401 [Ustilaginoidea virens]|uniref:DAGKc domain-containing protein n=1 Tax=Ustilaginoidea virens TaxID=1159556 RepID=A0A8E5HRR6_USTVR|nr:uncharacterized protein UV8b_04401 [Ustilaginoidea virens]QUC20160.1 hypothetical protein UV8b_04401 [Ustilaginoidea virens]
MAAVTRVERVQLHDETLSWTCSSEDKTDAATLDQVLFVLESPDPSHAAPTAAYVICCLKEDPEDSLRPYQLLLLSCETVPEKLRGGRRLVRRLPDHLRCTPRHQVDVLVSTKSGRGRAPAFWQHVLGPLLQVAGGRGSGRWNVVTTQDAHSVRRYAATLGGSSSSPSRCTVLLSGDGGLADLLNGRPPVPGPAGSGAAPLPLVVLLPLGTANALFHSLHRPVGLDSPATTPLVLALRTLFFGVAAELPVFRASFSPGAQIASHAPSLPRAAADADADADAAPAASGQHADATCLYGAVVASYALHASIVYESDTPEHRVLGSQRFAVVAQRLLRESHPYKASLHVRAASSPVLERDPHPTHGYVLVSMVSNLERTFTISPRARPLDGNLHLVRLGPLGEQRIMEVMMKAYDGGSHTDLQWDDGEKVRHDQVDEVEVVTEEEDARWRVFCVDGTIVHVPKGGSMTVRKADERLFRVLVDEAVEV